ncbi:hypothetical protein F-liban_230 [Faustovirus]|nr:hypothetical protein F-liban_230 [Faustovirus]SME64906.1 Hypothetical protein FSTVST1_221 [Faustovirus ST1]
MEIFTTLTQSEIKLYSINIPKLREVYAKYYPSSDGILDECINVFKRVRSDRSGLPQFTINDSYIEFNIEPFPNKTGICRVMLTREYTPMYDSEGNEVFIVEYKDTTTWLKLRQMKKKEIIDLILSNNAPECNKLVLFMLLKRITFEDLVYITNEENVRLSGDNYRKLLAHEVGTNPSQCCFDFAIECSDGVKVMFHKALLCLHSPMMKCYNEDIIPSPDAYPGFPFNSELVLKFRESFYNQVIRSHSEQDLIPIYDYLQIECKERIINRFASMMGCKIERKDKT